MKISTSALVVALAVSVEAKLHNFGACVRNRVEQPIGGTGWSVSYSWSKKYEIMPEATKCACDYYRRRNTGNKQWDQCPDCHMLNHYCTKYCGAPQSEGSNS
ncbi:hypothetical protein CBS470a_012023 [Colletotrichum nupharicola]|nr:hypothetical protein CBS470a_012023 [Colletotrichum nupharicola]